MINYAFVKPNGLVGHVASPALDDMYVDGQVYGEDTCRALPADAPIHEVIDNWCWKDGEWTVRPPRPGTFYQYVNDEWVPNPDAFYLELRRLRDYRLAFTDWTQVPDNQLTESDREDWRTYRQALRDFPETYDGDLDMKAVTWPTPPEELPL